jgi:hypothetical protein
VDGGNARKHLLHPMQDIRPLSSCVLKCAAGDNDLRISVAECFQLCACEGGPESGGRPGSRRNLLDKSKNGTAQVRITDARESFDQGHAVRCGKEIASEVGRLHACLLD